MPGTPALGSLAAITVGTTLAGATTLLGGLVSWDYVGDSPTTRRDYYGQASSTATGKTARTVTFAGDYETGDAGQLILGAAFVSKAIIYTKILPDGTNGETLPSRVAHQEIHGPDANQFSTVNWTLEQATDPTVIAGGFFT